MTDSDAARVVAPRGIMMALIVWSTIVPAGACAQAHVAPAGAVPQTIRDSIAGTLITFELVRVPGGTVTLTDAAGARTVTVAPFYIGRTEVTWDMYDVYLLRLDRAHGNAAADAVARPSMPYAVPDYDWGHEGYAAISIAHGAAQSFTTWLSAKTGHRYRLPTEAEWLHAATAAAGPAPLTRERLDALAWHSGNAGGRTHAVAGRQPDALGLYDLFGNAAEWVTTASGGFMTRGGSFRDDVASVGPHARAVQDATWTERDPQLPKSRWWLSDAPFVGFRIVRELQPVR